MRICLIHGSNDTYGASRVLLDDVAVLHSLGHQTEVCLPSPGPLVSLVADRGGVAHVTSLKPLRRVNGIAGLRVPVRLPEPCLRAELVVIWTLAMASYLPALRVHRVRTIVSVHEILPGRIGNLLAMGSRAAADEVMCNSIATSEWFHGRRRLPPDIVAYPAAPAYDPLPLDPSPAGSIRLLLAGRVNGHKGHREAILACDLARARGIDATLDLVGGPFPGQEAQLEEVQTLAADRPWVVFRGETSDVRRHLARCDVMVIPTTKPEPFGIVALEAWSAGRRVIASDGGGLSEAARMVDGMLVRPGDVDDLAGCIEQAARDPELRSPPPADASAKATCTLESRREAWLAALRANAAPQPETS